MKRLITCYCGSKTCAKQVVLANFDKILYGTFRVPAQEEMEKSLKEYLAADFDEYKERSKIVAAHPGWSIDQVKGALDRKRMRHENEYRSNLRQAAAESISEIEQLVSSLNDTIKAWKIKNLG